MLRECALCELDSKQRGFAGADMQLVFGAQPAGSWAAPRRMTKRYDGKRQDAGTDPWRSARPPTANCWRRRWQRTRNALFALGATRTVAGTQALSPPARLATAAVGDCRTGMSRFCSARRAQPRRSIESASRFSFNKVLCAPHCVILRVVETHPGALPTRFHASTAAHSRPPAHTVSRSPFQPLRHRPRWQHQPPVSCGRRSWLSWSLSSGRRSRHRRPLFFPCWRSWHR